LNGSTIGSKERTDAERYYVSKMSSMERNVDERSARFEALCEQYGQTASAPVNLASHGVLKSRMLDITIIPDESLKAPPFHLSLLPSSPIRLLCSKVARKLGLPVTAQLGFSVRHPEEGGEARALDLGDGEETVDWLGLASRDVLAVIPA